jgi:hypothetical protein
VVAPDYEDLLSTRKGPGVYDHVASPASAPLPKKPPKPALTQADYVTMSTFTPYMLARDVEADELYDKAQAHPAPAPLPRDVNAAPVKPRTPKAGEPLPPPVPEHDFSSGPDHSYDSAETCRKSIAESSSSGVQRRDSHYDPAENAPAPPRRRTDAYYSQAEAKAASGSPLRRAESHYDDAESGAPPPPRRTSNTYYSKAEDGPRYSSPGDGYEYTSADVPIPRAAASVVRSTSSSSAARPVRQPSVTSPSPSSQGPPPLPAPRKSQNFEDFVKGPAAAANIDDSGYSVAYAQNSAPVSGRSSRPTQPARTLSYRVHDASDSNLLPFSAEEELLNTLAAVEQSQAQRTKFSGSSHSEPVGSIRAVMGRPSGGSTSCRSCARAIVNQTPFLVNSAYE